MRAVRFSPSSPLGFVAAVSGLAILVSIIDVDLSGANLSEAQANENTIWPESFDPAAAGVQIGEIGEYD